MDQNKNAQGQQNQNSPAQGSKDQNENWNDTSKSKANREPAESGRDRDKGDHGNMGGQERGSGKQGEKNSGGISNRGMSRSEEQADLPSRGDERDQSDR